MAECAVIGVADEIKGQVPRGFVVLKTGADAVPWYANETAISSASSGPPGSAHEPAKGSVARRHSIACSRPPLTWRTTASAWCG